VKSRKKSSLPKNKSLNRLAVVIPVYNHVATITEVVRQAMELRHPVFVVDDGSTDDTARELKKIQGITILRIGKTRAKARRF
jgi:glycosyltransferase involved in cell wall biosynthesis